MAFRILPKVPSQVPNACGMLHICTHMHVHVYINIIIYIYVNIFVLLYLHPFVYVCLASVGLASVLRFLAFSVALVCFASVCFVALIAFIFNRSAHSAGPSYLIWYLNCCGICRRGYGFSSKVWCELVIIISLF